MKQQQVLPEMQNGIKNATERENGKKNVDKYKVNTRKMKTICLSRTRILQHVRSFSKPRRHPTLVKMISTSTFIHEQSKVLQSRKHKQTQSHKHTYTHGKRLKHYI